MSAGYTGERSMRARPLRSSFVAVSALLLAACGEPVRPGSPPRHVLLITVEALRADHCSSLGYARHTTFSQRLTDVRALDVDRLAETGVLFANAFAPAPEPLDSLRALMRSASVAELAAEPEPEPAALVHAFAQAGFVCGAVLVPSESLAAEARAFGFELVEESLAGPAEPEPERAALEAALAWVAQRVAAGERYFLWIHLGRPAPPFESPPLADPYSQPQGDARARALDAYDGELAHTNALLCEFLESLEVVGGAPLGEVVIALCGLSGVALPPRQESSPRLDEAHLHVPLILRHPPSMTGRRILSEVVSLTDLAPTLLDWFGLDPARPQAGRSLMPLVDSYVELPFERRAALSVHGPAASVRSERWRLVQEGDEVHLFDVARDPEQLQDLGERESEERAALERELRGRRSEAGGQ